MTTARVFNGPEGWKIQVLTPPGRLFIEIIPRPPDGCEVPPPETDIIPLDAIGCEADLAGRISIMGVRIEERFKKAKHLGEILENLTEDGKVDEV